MNKTQKMKSAAHNTRKRSIKQWLKKVILFSWNLCKKAWRFICRVCTAIWNWLKSIDIVGMVNLTLLVAIIVLFTSLIFSFNKSNNTVATVAKTNNVVVANKKTKDNRKVVQRRFNTTLPLKVSADTGIKPQIKTVGVKKPVVVKEISLPAKELPKQRLMGDVIVDMYPSAPVLSNGVKVDGNLFIQNMRKYTLPCDAKIRGNLFIRNVDKLSFCGKFTVQGNIYVSPRSSFGPIPSDARIYGNVIL
jgi:hypothetical protein